MDDFEFDTYKKWRERLARLVGKGLVWWGSLRFSFGPLLRSFGVGGYSLFSWMEARFLKMVRPS